MDEKFATIRTTNCYNWYANQAMQVISAEFENHVRQIVLIMQIRYRC